MTKVVNYHQGRADERPTQQREPGIARLPGRPRTPQAPSAGVMARDRSTRDDPHGLGLGGPHQRGVPFLTPYRTVNKLNDQEPEKLRRHPFEVAAAVIQTYSVEGIDALTAVPGEVERLKWVGVYPQRQGGDAFMMRIKVPGGVLSAPQAREIGLAASAFCEGPDEHPLFGNNYADLTTRQAIQLHWLHMADIPRIWKRFARVGLTTVQACGDCARNVTSCAISGIDPNEVVDSLTAATEISDYFTGNRTYSNLPRKFKIAVTGCHENCARVEINDIGLWPARLGEATGFNVLAGGGLSDGERLASDLDLFIEPAQAVELCRAIAQLYGELGNRENRGLARMRYLVEELGAAEFRRELLGRLGFAPKDGATPLTTGFRRDHVGVHPQRQPGLMYVGCVVPVGRLRGSDLVAAAGLAERYGDGTVRIGVDQNLTFSGVPEARVDELLAEDLLVRYSPNAGPFTRGVVACTGNEFCRYAITETKERAVRLARRLDARVEALAPDSPLRDTPLRIHMSGCSASCSATPDRRRRTARSGHQRGALPHGGIRHRARGRTRPRGWLHRLDRGRRVGRRPRQHDLAHGARLRRAAVGRRVLHLVEPPHRRRRPARRRERRSVMKGYRLREQMNSITEPPLKTWFWELQAAVIEADRCVQCGVCVAVCPSNSIGVQALTNVPELVKMCTGCSLCWDFCPRAGLRYETTWYDDEAMGPDAGGDEPVDAAWKITGGDEGDVGLGQVIDTYAVRAARSVEGAQDGGAVSAILAGLLSSGSIDGALVSKPSDDPDEPWKGVATIARTPDEVYAAAGSFYNQTMALAELDLSKYALPSRPRIAVVGTPCEVQGLRAMQLRPWSTGAHRVDAVVLTIALMCTKSFDYEALILRELQRTRGVDLQRVKKIDVVRGRLIVEYVDGAIAVDEAIRDFHGASLKGCDECADFLGRAANLTVGSVGSLDGWTSVLVRTERGRVALDRARPMLDLREIDNVSALIRLDELNKKVADSALRRPFDPDASMFIDFSEHVEKLRAYRSSAGHAPSLGRPDLRLGRALVVRAGHDDRPDLVVHVVAAPRVVRWPGRIDHVVRGSWRLCQSRAHSAANRGSAGPSKRVALPTALWAPHREHSRFAGRSSDGAW